MRMLLLQGAAEGLDRPISFVAVLDKDTLRLHIDNRYNIVHVWYGRLHPLVRAMIDNFNFCKILYVPPLPVKKGLIITVATHLDRASIRQLLAMARHFLAWRI